jgi:ABC-type iron transport system FetAB permease component
MTDVGPTAELGWSNVGLGLSFIIFNVAVSTFLGLGVGHSLLVAAIRCVIQLAVVAILLQKVFETENPFAVAGITSKPNSFEHETRRSQGRFSFTEPPGYI